MRPMMRPYIMENRVNAPEVDESVAQSSHFHVDVHPQRPHQASDRAHGEKDGQVPDVIKHARARKGQAVRVQAKVAVSPEMRRQDVVRVLLHSKHACRMSKQCMTICRNKR